jgi:DNA repair protein RadD
LVNFDHILQRADDETLQILVGRSASRLLSAIDPTLIRPAKLREVLINISDRTELLRDPDTREELISLLRPKEAKALADLLTFNPDDPYKALKRVNFRKNSNDEKLLFDFFEIENISSIEIEAKPSKCNSSPKYSLFKHQRSAAKKVKETVFEGDRRRVLLHMPTGSGKTRTTMNIISDYLRNNEPALIVWLAYSEELCEQAASEFESSWSFLGNREISINRFWGNHEIDVDEVKDGIIISSLGKMYHTTNKGLYKLGQLGSKSSLIIFDEAHQAIAPTFKYVLNALLQHSSDSALIGLSVVV